MILWVNSFKTFNFCLILGAIFFFSSFLNSSESRMGLRITATKAMSERESTVGKFLLASLALMPLWGQISFLITARPFLYLLGMRKALRTQTDVLVEMSL